MTTSYIPQTTGLPSIMTGDSGPFTDAETSSTASVILLTTGNSMQLVGFGGAQMSFIATGAFDTLDTQGSSNATYNAILSDDGTNTFNEVDALSRGSGILNGAGIQVNGFAAGDILAVYGFGAGSTVTQAGSALHFAGVNGSSFNVIFNGVAPNTLMNDLLHNVTVTAASSLWSMHG